MITYVPFIEMRILSCYFNYSCQQHGCNEGEFMRKKRGSGFRCEVLHSDMTEML